MASLAIEGVRRAEGGGECAGEAAPAEVGDGAAAAPGEGGEGGEEAPKPAEGGEGGELPAAAGMDGDQETKKAKKEDAAGNMSQGEADAAATDWETILSILLPHVAENGVNGRAGAAGLLFCAPVCKLWRTQVDAALKCVRLLSFRSWQGRVHAADVLRVLKRMGGPCAWLI